MSDSYCNQKQKSGCEVLMAGHSFCVQHLSEHVCVGCVCRELSDSTLEFHLVSSVRVQLCLMEERVRVVLL